MAHLLGAEALHLEFPTRTVFDSVTIGINEGDRVGVVGRNGDGKSSLLAMLTGRLEPDSGQVTRRKGVQFGVLDQSDDLDDEHTVGYSVVGDADDHEWASDAKIRDVIAGLVTDIPWESKISELSGGQRRRVALAKLLVGEWDIIALDEPTNHLDVEGISWLANHLNRRWPRSSGGLLVVTHDRWFLDEISTTTWEVHDGMVEPFDGGYAAYVLQRVERDRQAATVEAKRQNLMKKELAWLRRGAPARSTKPKFRIEAANELIADVPPPRNPLELKKMATARLGKDVVDVLDVSIGFGDKPILNEVTWRIGPGERTGILGANGAGKSTLLNLIAGKLEPDTGRVKRGKTVRLATLDQQFSQLADIEGDRVREVLAREKTQVVIDGKEHTPAQLLERLGFSTAHLSARVGELSGGQRRRLQLLLVLLSEPNVMILDEPTNDLDIDMLAAMEDLLDSWPGTLIVVSHDRYLLERVTDQQYAIFDGRMRHVPGGVEEYLRLKAARANGASAESAGSGTSGSGGGAAGAGVGSGKAAAAARREAMKTSSASSAGAPALSSAEEREVRKEVGALERKMQKLITQMEKKQRQMADHDPSDFEGLGKLTADVSRLQGENEKLEERWLELSEKVG
ncbi:ABC-F family ATP-binding cassette domain-containing protein [Nesterenkonia sp. LB17]|uniref:ABC-F family ATP-binding cassette domain-containing protein n=1 Tax=unclassified Nesterenkonia TaxID=2629769 RepID=UPI001F4C6D27|nr:ABC-F family ATP-binding cassette domain-containing protein [Nesterenkonia sp. YGD6]MCH8566415.1 ABC-F family ATP-binding cassette domain-containing protein [Nesterenkonia sp. LB17]